MSEKMIIKFVPIEERIPNLIQKLSSIYSIRSNETRESFNR